MCFGFSNTNSNYNEYRTGSKNGILIKSGKVLETARDVGVVIFDKTGILTRGEPVVTDIITNNFQLTSKNILKIAMSVEKNSEHPLGEAIVKKAKEENLELFEVKNFQAILGHGILTEFDGKKIFLGTRKLIVDNQIDPSLIEEKLIELENQGKTAMLLAKDKKIIGIIAVADTLQEYSKEAVNILHKMGKK